MKINPYYIAAAVAVAVIVIIFVSRRDNATRDWNSTNFILSADNTGNLTSISEAFFEQKETELLAKVDKLTKVADARSSANTTALNTGYKQRDPRMEVTLRQLRPFFVNPTRGQHQNDPRFAMQAGWKNGLAKNAAYCGQLHAKGSYQCPGGTIPAAWNAGAGRCGCIAFKGKP